MISKAKAREFGTDALVLCGYALLIYGTGLIYFPAGVLAAGIVCLRLAQTAVNPATVEDIG